MPRWSAIVPTRAEAARIGPLVRALRAEVDEVVVSDAGGADGTAERAAAAGAAVVGGAAGRGPQLDRGAAAAGGEWLWFVHADAGVPAGARAALDAAAARADWGFVPVAAPGAPWPVRAAAAAMNARGRWTGSATGDMGLWCRASLFWRLGGFGPLAAFEDLSFTDRARRAAPWAVAEARLGLDPRRWAAGGVGRTVLRMWALRLGYRLGVEPGRLVRVWEGLPRG
jgi:glycosyltransferase involved in cell wall biosynthesis